MSLLSDLIDSVTARRAKKTGDYADVVRSVADNKRVDASTVDAVLRESGKSTDDLKADVSRVLRRRELANLIGRRPEIEAQIEEHKQKGETSQREWELVYNARNRAVNAWLLRRDQLRDELAKAEAARVELESTFSRVDELAAARGKGNVLREQIIACETQIREAPLRAAECRAQGEMRRKGSPEQKDWERRAVDCEDEAKRAEAMLPNLREQLADAEHEEARLYGESQRP